MIILAVDLGAVRTGLALCDKGERMAFPLCIITERRRDALLARIVEVIKERGVEHIVVGHPRNMDGSEGNSAKNAASFAEALRKASGFPVELRDERGTSVTAHGYLNTTDTRGKKRKAVVDAVAATIILQDYLDFRKNQT